MEKPRNYASICAIIRKNRVNKDGEHPVVIRVTKNREVAIMATGYSSQKSYWDKKNSLPNEKHPNYSELKKVIEDAKELMKSIMRTLAESGIDFNAQDIIDRYKQSKDSDPTNSLTIGNSKQLTVRIYYDKLIDRMNKKGQFSTLGTYVGAFNWLDKYRSLDSLLLTDLNRTFLEDLLAFMISEKLKEKGIVMENGKVSDGKFSENTLFGYFKNFKSLMNKAVDEEIISETASNFKKFSLSQFKTEINPRPIEVTEIDKIMKLELKPYTRMQNI